MFEIDEKKKKKKINKGRKKKKMGPESRQSQVNEQVRDNSYLDSELQTMNAIGIPVCTFRSLTRIVNKYADVNILSSSGLGFSDLTVLCVESMHTIVVLSFIIYGRGDRKTEGWSGKEHRWAQEPAYGRSTYLQLELCTPSK